MTITYHRDLIQGSEAWLAHRCGTLSASEMKKIITPTLKVANNGETRSHAYEMAFQRITNFVEPQYVSDAMLRGHDDEIFARAAYAEHYAPVVEAGFVTNDKFGFVIGWSPDGLVGDDGAIECKSRCGKYHVQTIADDEVPAEYLIQLQTALLVSERKWIDFISYCGGLPMFVKRVEPDPDMQAAIVAAAVAFEERVRAVETDYHENLSAMSKVIETERNVEEEMVI